MFRSSSYNDQLRGRLRNARFPRRSLRRRSFDNHEVRVGRSLVEWMYEHRDALHSARFDLQTAFDDRRSVRVGGLLKRPT